MENPVRVPAALHRWAAEHNQHLSATTRSEVDVIASIIDASSLRDRHIESLDDEFAVALQEIFPEERADRAQGLLSIVADWYQSLPTEAQRTTVAEVRSIPPSAANTVLPTPPVAGASSGVTASETPAGVSATNELGAPAFLRSDKVDEDDSARLYGGSAPSFIRPVLAVLSVLLLAAVGVGVWLWASSDPDDPTELVDTADGVDATGDGTITDGAGAIDETPTAVPTATPEPVLSATRSSWADTTTILNAGTGSIISSTYPVSSANRAVLTGHTAAITGIVISDDGRVLTSGADQRLVDWGSDVTLASPDVLDVDTPLTVLTRTVDQKVVAGDANGNITVIDLINTAEPQVVAVHPSAISAADELVDGRLAVASVDGDVAVLSLQAPGDALSLPHNTEVTAVVGLGDGTVATASVDGSVRVWPATGGAPLATISTLNAPVTAMHLLSDGQLATASVDGRIHVVPAVDAAEPTLSIEAHEGAVRALWELTDENGSSLASGSDDSTIRVFSLTSGQQVLQLDGHGDLVSALAQLPDGRLVSTSGDGTGRVWDLSLGSGTIVQPPHEWNLSHVAAWRNDQFVSGGVDGLVMLASTAETTAPEQITRHDAPVVGLTVMPNGDIVSLDANSTMRLIQLGPDAGEPFEIQVAAGATALDNRDGLGVVTGHTDGTIHFSDFTADIASVQVHGGGVTDVLGLSSGLVASASDDNTVRIVDLDNPEQIPVFDLHTNPVNALAELPDGRIASASVDGIFVWSVEDMGAEHIRLNGHQLPVLTLFGLPDGRLLSTAADGRVRIWDLQNPTAEPTTLIDIPGVVNPELVQAGNGLFVAGAGRGYVVFAIE